AARSADNPPLERTAAAVYFTSGRASRVRRRGRSTAIRYHEAAVGPCARAIIPLTLACETGRSLRSIRLLREMPMSQAAPTISYAGPQLGVCQLCHQRPAWRKLLYGHPVCKKCYYKFANRRQLAYVVDSLL